MLSYPLNELFFSSYNNKTYRVDDIKWDKFPNHTFHGRIKGVERDISYVEYYEEVCCLLKTRLSQCLGLLLAEIIV